MSNNTNLSKLANVLDDGSSGQYLKSTGSGGVVFDDVAAGAVVYANPDLLPLSGNSAGDMAYVTSTNRFYINNGSGWYSVSLVNTNPNITSVQDASSGTTPFTLTTDGTATVITITASDPEEVPLTYGYSVTSGSLTNGGGTTATVTQGTGSNTNQFTVTPSTNTAYGGTFTLTFTASDGINQAQSANVFSLNFVTQVTDSKHTTLLAQAVGSGTNSSITDSHSSSSPHTFTNTGTPTAGTFSPYREGGYSAYGHFRPETTSGTLDTYSLSFWYKLNSVVNAGYLFETQSSSFSMRGETASGGRFEIGGALYIQNDGSGNNYLDSNWHYFVVSRTSSATSWYIDGSQITTDMFGGSVTLTLGSLSAQAVRNMTFGGRDATSDLGALPTTNLADIEFRDIELKSTTHNGTVPTEPVTSSSDTVFLTAHKPYSGYDYGATPTSALIETLGTNFETRSTSPYDYSEYDAADNGGSIYFPTGTRTRLASASTDLELGTGNWTIEGWLFHNGMDGVGDRYILDFRDPTPSSNYGSNRIYALLETSAAPLKFNANNAVRITGPSIKENQWYYWALCRSGTNTKMFLNGEQVGSTWTGDNLDYEGQQPTIGGHNTSTTISWNGYISDLKITKSDLYTADFTPPTAPLASTNSVLHMKGADASILDAAQSNNLELSNNISPTSVLTSSTTPAYIGASWAGKRAISFGNSGGNSARTKSFLPINEGSYTVEGWINLNSSSGTHTFFDSRLFDPSTNSNAGFYMMWRTDSGNYFRVGSGDGVYLDNIGSGDSLSTGTWYHFSLVRDASQSSNNTAFFIGGIRKSQMHDTRNKTSDQATIGSNYSNSSIMDGYLQDFRVSHKARYDVTSSDVSSNIPTAPLEG